MEKQQIEINYFLNNNIVNQKTVKQYQLSNSDKSFSEFLLENNYIKEMDYIKFLGYYHNIPCIDLDMIKVSFEFEKYFNIELLKSHNFLPIVELDNSILIVAISNPSNVFIKSIILESYSKIIEFVLTSKQKIENFLNSYSAKKTTTSALNDILKDSINEKEKESFEILDFQNTPTVKFVDSIIREAIPLNASDIHIEPREEKVAVRYRIDGDLVLRAEFPIESYSAVCARIKIISNMDIAERRIPQDGRISLKINDEDFDFRVSSLPTINGEKFVIRILDNKMFSYSRKELNFSDESNQLIEKILKHPHGIILLTGPTGCGKTTTLYSFLKELNKENKNLITIEDPVEYSMEGINQIQINNKADLTFASCLRSILRQDPDIIMVGEIRDSETAQIAIRAAITGHLVLSTLHTNNAPGAVIRLIDMGIEPFLVSDALVAVISQRLIKKLCPVCKQKVKTNIEQMKLLNLTQPTYIYKAKGCPYCNNTGYKGRVAVHEIMNMNDKIRNKLNTNGLDVESLKQVAIENGMTTLLNSARAYVLSGIASLDELISLMLSEEN